MVKRALLYLLSLFLVLGPVSGCRQAEPAVTPEQHDTDIPYGDHPLQTMDIHVPEGPEDARYPVVLTLHGGEWLGGDKASMAYYTDTVLAADCIHVNINYRLLNDGIPEDAAAPYEAMLDDIEAAPSFLAENAREYRIDTARAGIAGYSSGGHLAMLYAYTRTAPPIPIRFVISEAGPANFLDPKTFTENGEIWLHEGHEGHGDVEVWPGMAKDYRLAIISAITGRAYGETGWEDAWAKASPALVVSDTAPKTYLFYGTHDAVVPISHGELLAQNHPDCVLYEIIDGTHDLHTKSALERFHARLAEILQEF